MNWFQILGLANQIASIMAIAPPGLAGDTLLYWAVRKFAERLEQRNPGIAERAGFNN